MARTTLDLHQYRPLAGLVVALTTFQGQAAASIVDLHLGSQRDAQWLGNQLERQGFAVEDLVAEGEAIRMTVHK